MIRTAALVVASACTACLALQKKGFQPGSDHVDAFSPQSSELESGKARAERFDSPRCERAKARPDGDLNWWKRSMLSSILKEGQHFVGITDKKVLYVRNQKAGSAYLLEHFAEMFGEEPDAIVLTPLKNYAPPAQPTALTASHSAQSNHIRQNAKTNLSQSVGQSWSAFTVVRDPIHVAVAAYLEISHRLKLFGTGGLTEVDDVTHETVVHPYPEFHAMPCESKVQANERFKSYLKTVRSGEKISKEFFHAYPQALKVNVNFPNRKNTFDLIADVDHLSRDLCGISSFSCEDIKPPTESIRHSHKTEPCSPDLNDTVIMKELCDLYQVDYECFGYTMPPACS
eukprot:TRINITY_DN3053_c0_g5_i1.p1 TRINITY_DN3053_c0_g5~~TRINITY_DN3053_c0_g5_i1.p1  ORF type:complete len:342 (+),score=45.12 TRINITY_DN3053_c0_g5_i1:95-1120(+)